MHLGDAMMLGTDLSSLAVRRPQRSFEGIMGVNAVPFIPGSLQAAAPRTATTRGFGQGAPGRVRHWTSDTGATLACRPDRIGATRPLHSPLFDDAARGDPRARAYGHCCRVRAAERRSSGIRALEITRAIGPCRWGPYPPEKVRSFQSRHFACPFP